jgi:'Cold-shock' DNA-binding domain
MRDRCAVLRTLLQCVCTQRRNCIGQLSPFSEYAPTALRNKWKPAATIKLIHYRRLGATPHESSASGGYLGIQCPQRFQSLDATHNWDCRYPAQRTARPLRREPAGFAIPFIQPDNGSKDVFVHISAVDGTATNCVTVA